MQNTKRAIYITAMSLFATKGYDATSIEEITAVAGMAKGTLYYHFKSKEEIFNYVAQRGTRLAIMNIRMRTKHLKTSLEKLKMIIKIQLEFMVKYEKFVTFLLSQLWGERTRQERLRKYVSLYMKQIETIVKECIEQGYVNSADPELISTEIFRVIASAKMYHQAIGGRDFNVDELTEKYFDYIMNGIKKV